MNEIIKRHTLNCMRDIFTQLDDELPIKSRPAPIVVLLQVTEIVAEGLNLALADEIERILKSSSNARDKDAQIDEIITHIADAYVATVNKLLPVDIKSFQVAESNMEMAEAMLDSLEETKQ